MSFNGYTNWESFSFSVAWSNDQEVYRAVKRAGQHWLAANAPKDDSAELGAAIVAYVRGGVYAPRFIGPKRLETEAEWDAIDRREVGEEVKTVLETETAPVVTTWADAAGTWHAKVTEQDVTRPILARRMARKAIVAELTQRAAPGWKPADLRVEMATHKSHNGTIETEFVESWPTD